MLGVCREIRNALDLSRPHDVFKRSAGDIVDRALGPAWYSDAVHVAIGHRLLAGVERRDHETLTRHDLANQSRELLKHRPYGSGRCDDPSDLGERGVRFCFAALSGA